MEVFLVFSAALVLSVLISGLARRSLLSTAVLFLVTGLAVGKGVLGLATISPNDTLVVVLSELALVSVVFSDGMQVGIHDLLSAWRLPGRALFLGLPLTLVGTATVGHAVAGLPWAEAFLIAAVLSPTDPVFASAVVGREEVPASLRHLLNVESGVNDGLALPIVLITLSIVEGTPAHSATTVGQVVLGTLLGVAIPWLVLMIQRVAFFSPSAPYQPLNAFAIGLLVFTLCSSLHANPYLAAFAAGVTIATVDPSVRDAFGRFGELVAELLKLAALLVFGALILPDTLASGIGLKGYAFAGITLFVVRPLALSIALLRSRISWPERAVAAWFGPRGFASVVYGLMMVSRGVPNGDTLFHLVAVVVAASIVIHSSTDVLAARWFRRAEEKTPTGRTTSQTSNVRPGNHEVSDNGSRQSAQR
jgi:NhaP-type Na+/H+ or K+/H+ antiporter